MNTDSNPAPEKQRILLLFYHPFALHTGHGGAIKR